MLPDLLVTQALCDICAVAEAEVQEAACRLPERPCVINLEPMSLKDVFGTLLMVGKVTETEAKARQVVDELRGRVSTVEERTQHISAEARVAFVG